MIYPSCKEKSADINHTNFFLYEFQLHYLLKSNLIEKDPLNLKYVCYYILIIINILGMRKGEYESEDRVEMYQDL